MENLKRLILLFAVALSFANIGYSQSREFKIKGVMVDSIRNEALEFATVTLYEKGAKLPSKYALSNSKGEFELATTKAGDYLLKVEYMGFTPIEKSITVGKQRVMELGNVGMLEQINLLDQVVVSELGNPVIIKKDTIEYSATAFKSTDNDMLEDLLKKLPGIEIDSDGKITAHGKQIDKIMVDGKPLFFNDPALATKNLPAKIIDKVKVIDRMSEQSRFTGIYDGNEETIIDLSIRPGMMNGWFGNVNGGYGTSDRYQAAGMVGNFTENYQLSLIANANNSNNRSFSDFGGDAMRSMRSTFSGGGGGRGGGIRVGGTTLRFGGNGITSSQMGGINANTQTKNEKFKIGGNYFYGSTDNVSESNRIRQTFLADSSFYNRDESILQNFSGDHRVALELEWSLSENTSIIFRPNMSIGEGAFSDENSFSTEGAFGTLINDGSSHSYGDSRSQGTGGDLLFRQRLGKPGRTFSVSFNYNYSDRDLIGVNYSELNSYKLKPDHSIETTTNIVDQKYDLTNKSLMLGARASYTEPLGSNFFMELAYRYSHSVNKSEKNSYNKEKPEDHDHTVFDEEYSNSYKNTFISQMAEINILKNEEKYNYTLGFNVQPSYTESIGLDAGDIERSVVNFSPSAMFNYRFNKERSLRLDYRGTTSQPSLNQLQPVPDNSNPLYIPIGNPDLLPVFNHRLYVTLRNSNRAAYRSLNFRLGGNYYMDRIVNATIYDSKGVRYSIPVNTNGSYSIFSNVMYNTPVGSTKFNLSSSTRLSLNRGINYNSIEEEVSLDPAPDIDELMANAIKNKTTSLSLTENLRFTYRGEKMESSIGGRASYSYAWYSIEEENSRPATWNNALFYYMNWSLPGGLNFMTDINYQFYIGYEESIIKPATIWNLELSKLLFKNKATLGVRVYDLLNQSRSVYRDITDNYIEDSSNNTLQRYIMVNFIYRFGKFGKDSVTGRTPGMGPGGGRGMYRGMH
ncbi:MAG: outer membrane beta-barrel protein [Bacteroidales bacterium]